MIKKGTMFIISSGEYEDYKVMTICRAKADIDPKALYAEYIQVDQQSAEDTISGFGAFAKWMIVDKRLCEELDYTELYLGSIRSFELEEIPRPDKIG